MFSFFGKKKHSPDTPPNEEADPIPGPDSGQPNSDDFIVVEPKDQPQPNPSPNMGNSYYPGRYQPMNRPEMPPVPYHQGIPFKLAPELCQEDSLEATQMEIDEIVALMTRTLQFNDEYEFSLERGLVEQ